MDVSRNYDKIKDSDKRDTSTRLGALSIICTIVGAILTALFAWGFLASVQAFSGDSLLSVILAVLGVVICFAGIIASVFDGILKGLMYWIYQMKLNKRAIGKVALVLWILFSIGSIVGTVLLLSSF